MACGPAAGLAITEAIRDGPAHEKYHLLPRARGGFLFKLGRFTEARLEFGKAAELTQNGREKSFFLARSAACGNPA
jgi:RNA polymerase sigma-70 factor, ECF subfamily